MSSIIELIFKLLDFYRNEFNLNSNDYYFQKLAHPNRFDSAEIIFIKRLLQSELSTELRDLICSALFNKFVSEDESGFSKELYMNKEQLKEMVRAGMHIGSHGNSHQWLSTLPRNDQKDEIISSLKLLEEIGCDVNCWTMCYPFGDYNLDTINVLKELDCKMAFTTKVGLASRNKSDLFEMPRLDTNDLPTSENTPTNKWYAK